jgi:hypothetical protein
MSAHPEAAPVRLVLAREDPTMRARVVRRTALRYAEGADPALDRPAHVRAGSSLARVGDHLAVIQDDANFLALVDPDTGLADAVALPAGEGGKRQFDSTRGNKAHKLDLEACVTLEAPDGAAYLVAFGSGSTPRREQVLVAPLVDARVAHDAVRLVEAPGLYAALRAVDAFAGAELNVEGAARIRGPGAARVRLFGRGNGATRDGVLARDATCDLDAAALLRHLLDGASVPEIADVVQYDLGTLDGCRLGFTDASALHGADEGTLVFCAAAEDSPNAVDDGAVTGSVIGVLDATGARWTPIPLDGDDAGHPPAKVEGVLAMTPDGTRLWVVTDVDDPAAPAELWEIELRLGVALPGTSTP